MQNICPATDAILILYEQKQKRQGLMKWQLHTATGPMKTIVRAT
jgi:hypothetical protein